MTRWLLLASVVVVLDQLSKYAIASNLAYGAGVELTGFFNLVLVHNRGAAFSFLATANGWQRELFIGIAGIASVWVIYLLRKHGNDRPFCFGLSLILGGAIGNVIDRVRLGAVIDFLDFHALGWHWPAFNVADAAITCGAAFLIWDALRSSASKTASSNSEAR
jgi:signal peptidase II